MKNIPSLVKKIISILSSKKQTISFAESCTGGRIAVEFTAISGASSVLNGSCVTYSNEIKHQWLDVENSLLEEFGAVSSQCVSQMLIGIQKLASSDYAIAVSGIAGPNGGTKEKPIGTVYIGVQSPSKQEVFKCYFHGTRNEIQAQSTAFAIEKIIELLEI